ncbi:conserved exported hypothetical protein [Verrucomicrobia bacterium]|nr:conserved exported hypothetical protein [Verrucomicrobiota bacterium]
MNTIRIRNLAKIGALLLCFLYARPGWAATFTLNPQADAFVTTGPSGNLSHNNYGGAGALCVAAPGLAQGEFQSVVQFGLSGAKSSFDTQFGNGDWTLQSVSLQLTATPPNNGIFNATAAGAFSVSLMQNNGWSEGTGTPMSPTTTGITFSTLSNFVGVGDSSLGRFSFSGATNGAASYTLNPNRPLSAEILAGGTASLRMFADDTSVSYLFDSRSFNNASARPLLTITAVPEPGGLALGALALCCLAGRRLVARPKPC